MSSIKTSISTKNTLKGKLRRDKSEDDETSFQPLLTRGLYARNTLSLAANGIVGLFSWKDNSVGPKVLGSKEVKRGSSKRKQDISDNDNEIGETWIEKTVEINAQITFYTASQEKSYAWRKSSELKLAADVIAANKQGIVLESLEVSTDIPVIFIDNKNMLNHLKNKARDSKLLEQRQLLKMHHEFTMEMQEENAVDILQFEDGYDRNQVNMTQEVLLQNCRKSEFKMPKDIFIVQVFESTDLDGGQRITDMWKVWSNLGTTLMRLKDIGLLAEKVFFLNGRNEEKIQFLVLIKVVLFSKDLVYLLELVNSIKVNSLNGYISVYIRK